MSDALSVVAGLLGRCGLASSVLPPTELFNEGWMLRLLLDWLEKHPEFDHQLSPKREARWYSEALLPSRFLPTSRGDARAESFTHADAVIGHFQVESGTRGDAKLLPSATQFVVTEAKLGSALSAGTKNAPKYDQAARNVACMAHMLSASEISADSMEDLGFFVLAPRSQIQAGVFGDLMTRESIECRVRERVGTYGGIHDDWFTTVFQPMLTKIELELLPWEVVLESLPETQETAVLSVFYEQCLRFNPLRGRLRI